MNLNKFYLSICVVFLNSQLTFAQASEDTQLDILILGSTRSFSEGEGGASIPFNSPNFPQHTPAFNPEPIANDLRKILNADPQIKLTVNVVVENIAKQKELKIWPNEGNPSDTKFDCHTLTQYYHWPDGRANTLNNLKGEAGTKWDYVIIMDDPYILPRLPGFYAEGVLSLSKLIKQGSAEPILLLQWPADTTLHKQEHYTEITYRVGDSNGLRVIPAGIAWDSLASKDVSNTLPSTKGSIIAASSIYSTLFHRKAPTGSFNNHADVNADTLSSLAHNTVLNEKSTVHYKGEFSFKNPFTMSNRDVSSIQFHHAGSSTEQGIQQAIGYVFKRKNNVTTTLGKTEAEITPAPAAFNFGRGGRQFTPDNKNPKRKNRNYRTNPNFWEISYAFTMQDYRSNGSGEENGELSMRYGIDKRYLNKNSYEDGTDVGLATSMVLKNEVIDGGRVIPIHLIWAKLYDASNQSSLYKDISHLSFNFNEAIAYFVFANYTGRVKVSPKPNSGLFLPRWFPEKIGYETAWTLSTLTPPETFTQSWLITHSGNSSPTEQDWIKDFDGDGVSTRLEYALGGTNGLNDIEKLPRMETNTNGESFFVFNRRTSGLPGHKYYVKKSDNLATESWDVVKIDESLTIPHPTIPNFEQVRVKVPENTTQTFYRLVVE